MTGVPCLLKSESVFERIGAFRVVPVVAVESVERALPFADALIAGGLPIAEITFRTAAAADVIRLLSRERPELLVGAGTVTTAEQARAALECGAQFAVAPGFNPNVVRVAREIGLPFAPGVMTPSDIEGAVEAGVTTLKFFPAGAAGGISMLKSLAAPYAHLGVRFMPTGGVSMANLADYLSEPSVIAAGGTWLAKQDAIAEGRWEEISANCRAVRQLVERLTA
ncbi:MAG: bifunctional 4-hydroxy-2-oxoglutarate aldolase/2-dehydro-3-deoxy-phosphogluconate aldolase [Lentisphaerae bacterium]|nr:bifunctional 4-hydroxy-2-oxoglutarate aldolase/2-dehydro-3-deoxy-phosphogluconate aldolase [Lentisphaerota bacterium]